MRFDGVGFVVFLLVFLSIYSGLHLYAFLKVRAALTLSTGIYAGLLVFMILMTAWAMGINLVSFYAEGNWLLFCIGFMITVLQVWMVIEGAMVLARIWRKT